jgi:outer membrane receptor for ferrienterochelin and colicin
VSTDTKVSSIPSSDGSHTAHSGVIRLRRTAQGAYAVANLSYPLERSVQIGAQVNNLFDRTLGWQSSSMTQAREQLTDLSQPQL